MTEFEVLKWVHLLAAATWTGGLIVLAFLVGAARKAGADTEVLRAMARRFGVVSWSAMAIAVLAGLRLYMLIGLPWANFALKGTLIALSIGFSLFHHLTARRTSPALRGLQQGVILLLAIGIFGAAVVLA
ncbi:MAG: hypothetical protein BMS9Abin12_0731 [Acidimicrobiia bacterium]|nr:MAG: hypothetical protein BMS9Abin12_0731 [Acidimicrobiia bacterium]